MISQKHLRGIALVIIGGILFGLFAWSFGVSGAFWPFKYVGGLFIGMIAFGLYDLGILRRKGQIVDKPSGPVYKSDGSLANERKEEQS